MSSQLSQAQQQYLTKQKRHKSSVRFFRILILVVFLLLWEIATQMKWIDGFIFSSPSRLCIQLWKMCRDGSFFLHLGTTLFEVAISFLLICVIGYVSAVLLWFFPKLSEILEPYFVVLNSLPKSALAPLLIVWLGANMKTIIVAGISVAIFGTILSLYTAFSEVDPDKLLLIHTLQGNRMHIMTKVLFPATLPTCISLMKVNIGLCLVGVVIGEFLAARQGLGYLIIYGSQVFQLDMVILSIMVLCLVAMGLYRLIAVLEKKLAGRYT
ncbi:MAG: ABC transporter permease [Lachnospiraceae bacterium]